VREPFLACFPGKIPKGQVCRGVAGTVDILPTVARLTGAPLPKAPLDGVDIWPLLTGQTRSLEREALLYFDDWNLQCARWEKWKLHFARYNSMAYNPAPRVGRVNLPLDPPELYDLDRDPEESYNVAEENPQVVKEIQTRVERLLGTFPEEVRQAWRETRARQTGKTNSGALPVPR
jgi:arylsulfatase A